MSFLEEIKEIENERDNKENVVINEIVNYFTEKMNSDTFKNNLKRYITDEINNGKKSCNLKIEFWEYTSGCSDTYIYVSGCGKFEIKGEDNSYSGKRNYKGVRLYDIHKRICSALSEKLKEKIKELELKVDFSKRDDNRFGDYEEIINVSW